MKRSTILVCCILLAHMVKAQYAEIANPVYDLNQAVSNEGREVDYSSGDYFQGMTRKLMYDRMIIPYGVEVTYDKTVHILFPTAIRYVDLGSSDIIAGKAEGVENVLRVKAAIRNFDLETNFTVITEDGTFYTFNVKYAEEPEKLNIIMNDTRSIDSYAGRTEEPLPIYMEELRGESPRMIDVIMQSIYSNNKRHIRHIASKRFGIEFALKGIYIYNDLFYFHVDIKNSSYVPFDVDFISFRVVNKKMVKRTAMQEQLITPVRNHNYCTYIGGKSQERTVFTLPKFSLPPDKKLIVELHEKDGGRFQSFEIENSDLFRARLIDELKVY